MRVWSARPRCLNRAQTRFDRRASGCSRCRAMSRRAPPGSSRHVDREVPPGPRPARERMQDCARSGRQPRKSPPASSAIPSTRRCRDRPSETPAFARQHLCATACDGAEGDPRFHTAKGLLAEIGKDLRFAASETEHVVRSPIAISSEYRVFMNAGHAPPGFCRPTWRLANLESRSRLVPRQRPELRGTRGLSPRRRRAMRRHDGRGALRTNHSESWCINWSWDATIRMTCWNATNWDNGSKVTPIHPTSPTLERSTYVRGFVRQPPRKGSARRVEPSDLSVTKLGLSTWAPATSARPSLIARAALSRQPAVSSSQRETAQ